ncbi:MAG: hypothetical protein HXS41_05885 [Theionarchaea archaeon]|nr:hypothetical protein [Theionarchaea archaeon]MBU7001079.1 hypothetical protein [Theionarchaea archaeon]MBU7020568.1 hypothetical protein [Theionarchaea archaeon]MBU7034217.1 hypothetical protein [Theionarchaea archaeon]
MYCSILRKGGKAMNKKLKKCENCGREFDIKEKNRIVLEGWRDEKHLSRLYFCSRSCFVTFLKTKRFV